MEKNQKGYTLIELMIVVAVMGVLSAVAVPAYQNSVKKSEAATGLSTARALLTNIDMEVQVTGKFPTTLTVIGATATMNKLGNLSISAAAVNSVYGSVEFTFNTSSSLNTKKITFTRSATGWGCTQDTGQTLPGCS
jgi:type IV pilus assembly protein PilA